MHLDPVAIAKNTHTQQMNIGKRRKVFLKNNG